MLATTGCCCCTLSASIYACSQGGGRGGCLWHAQASVLSPSRSRCSSRAFKPKAVDPTVPHFSFFFMRLAPQFCSTCEMPLSSSYLTQSSCMTWTGLRLLKAARVAWPHPCMAASSSGLTDLACKDLAWCFVYIRIRDA